MGLRALLAKLIGGGAAKEQMPPPAPQDPAPSTPAPAAPPAAKSPTASPPGPPPAPQAPAPPAQEQQRGAAPEAPPATEQAQPKEPLQASDLQAPSEGLFGGAAPPGATMVMSTIGMDDSESQEPPVLKFSARLVVRGDAEQGPGESGNTFEIKEARVTIGRAPENSIQTVHPSVSSVHAQIHQSEEGYYILDLGSTNGTWVNDNEVTGELLTDGSRISLGASSLFYTRLGTAGVRPGALGIGSHGVIMVQAGPSQGRSFPVGEEDLVIGRQPGELGAQLNDQQLEPRHALVRPTPEGCLLYDLGSASGTKLNNVALTGSLLKNGDVIKLGSAELEFIQQEST